MKLINLIIVLPLIILGCNSSKQVISPTIEKQQLDTLVIQPTEDVKPIEEKNPYRATNTQVIDLINTDLDVKFNWEEESLTGIATITFKPYFYPQNHLVLDGKGFEIKSITNGEGKTLNYTYDTKKIDIDLRKTIRYDQVETVMISYIARPNKFETEGGSAAISSDKGLYFINADGSNPSSPQQIWTQGETQSNSMWMPTIDSPNQKMTTKIQMTVQDKYQTLSNGIMTQSKKLDNNMRQDTWVMDKPHAPYLTVMVVGDYATTHDTWNGLDVDYMVEEEFKDDAEEIFPHTKEMLTFFSEKLGVPYPWQKFSQVIVREYVSGAMENTTAVIFGDFIQKHKGDLIDNGNDYIVAHEMFHHWFGDYVTTESWSNLTLNEGFANYSEYLWQEHKYGKDAADQHLRTELEGYLYSAMNGTHPLIDFHYKSREDMFDAHTYNKGGCILHMLRNYLGDDAFFKGLSVYLQEHAYSTVEFHDLRLALEKVSGQDLNWFFDQWFMTEGHPNLSVNERYSIENNKLNITLDQSMNRNGYVYRLPMAIDIYDQGGHVTREHIDFTKVNQTFSFDLAQKPALVDVEADHVLVGEIDYIKDASTYAFQYKNAQSYLARYNALKYFEDNTEAKQRSDIFKLALKDKFWGLRRKAINNLIEDKEIAPEIAQMAQNDPHAKVRAAAITYLGATKEARYAKNILKTLKIEPSNLVIGKGLNALMMIDPEQALSIAKKFEATKSSSILKSLSDLYYNEGQTDKITFFENNFNKVKQEDAIYFIMNYGKLSTKLDHEKMLANIEKLHQLGLEKDQSMYINIGAVSGLGETAGMLQSVNEVGFNVAVSAIQDIIAKETNPQLISYYKQMMGQ